MSLPEADGQATPPLPIERMGPETLRRMLGLSFAESASAPPATELQALWTDLLDRDLHECLDELAEVVPGSLGDRVRACCSPGCRLRDLLLDTGATPECLHALKDLARTLRLDPRAWVPRPIAGVWYVTALVAARALHGSAASTLSAGALGQGVAWALNQEWLPESDRRRLAGLWQAASNSTQAQRAHDQRS